METELNKLVKDLKPSTATTYTNSYIRLRNHLGISPKKQVSTLKLKSILEKVNQIENPSSRANILVVLRKIFTDDSHQQIINEQYKLINQQKREVQIHKNNGLNESMPSYDELVNSLKQLSSPLKYIVNFLMLYVNVRNQDIMLIDVHSKPKHSYDDSRNHLIVDGSKVIYIRNKYKTARKYGQKKNTINSKVFTKMVKDFVGDETSKPLFTQKDGKPVTPSSYTSYLKKVVIKGLTEAQIMKITMKHIDEKGDYNMLRRVSNNRGTSVPTLLQDYDMTNVKEPSTEIQPDIPATQDDSA